MQTIDVVAPPAGTITSWSTSIPAGISFTGGPQAAAALSSGTFTSTNTTATPVTFTITASTGTCVTTTTATVNVYAALSGVTIEMHHKFFVVLLHHPHLLQPYPGGSPSSTYQ